MNKICLQALALFWILLLVVNLVWAQDYSFTYTCDNQGQVIHPDSLGYFATVLRNTGAQADTYRVIMDKYLPGIWQSIACFPWGCFFDSASVALAPAQQETITACGQLRGGFKIWPLRHLKVTNSRFKGR